MRVQAGLAFVQRVRPALYALLLASALLSFFAGGDVPWIPRWALGAAPILFGLFLIVFVIYRVALIRARHYPAATGLFQIGLGALVFVLLLPGTRRAIATRSHAEVPLDDVAALLDSADPRVRALAAEVAGDRGPGPRYARELAARLEDGDARVRSAARIAVAKALGIDPPANPADDAAGAALKSQLDARGWLSR